MAGTAKVRDTVYNRHIAKRNISMSNLTPDDVDLRLTASKAELSEEDQRLWLGLEDEKISRIAGDEANKQFTELVKQQNSGTESRLSTEVIHRSEGDVSNLNSLNAVAQALSDYRIKTDLEINNEVIARKALGVELNTRIDSFVSTWDHQKYLIYQAVQDVQDDIDGKYSSMDSRIKKYEDMLQDITTDSIQITMDNGEINMGAWTILSQAREWDLQIIGRMKDYQLATTGDLNQALEDMQNKLPVEQNIIDKAIQGLSNSQVIKDLDEKLTSNIADIGAINQDLLDEVTARQNEMIAQAQNTANAIKSQADELTAAILAETTARIDAVTREADIRTLQIEGINSSISEETEERIEEIRLLNDGLTAEVNSRVEGDQNITTALDNYKESNDAALANVRNTVEVLVSDTTVMSQTVSSLDARLTVTEADTATANSLAASANEKANTALTATTSLAERMESVEASIETVQGDLTNKVDVIAFNSLKTEVTAIDGRVTTNTANIASITGNITDISSQLIANTTAISELSTEQTQQGNDIEQVSSQITQLSADIDSVQNAVANKADASAVASLTTQVNQQGEDITLINSDVTTLKGSVSTIEGNLASKADVTAFNALDSKVTTVDGKVTALNSNIISLESRVSTAEAGLATKADASALNDIYTKTEVNNTIAGQLTSFKAGLAIGGDNLLTNTKTFNKAGTVELAKSTLRPNYASFGTAFVTHPDSMLWRTHTVIQVRSDWCGFYYSCNSDNPADWFADQDMTLSVWVKNISNADVNAYGIVPALGHVATISSGEWQRIVMPIEKGRALRNSVNQGLIEFNFTSTEGAFYYAAPMLQYGNVATAWQPSTTDSDFDATQFASATYVQNIESSVVAIDGRVTANTNSLTNLNTRVDNTQADLVNNYYTKSAANEATSGQIITMRSQLAYGARNFVRNTGTAFAGWYWMFQQPLTTKLQGEVTISFDIEVITNSPGGNGAGVGFNMGDGGTGGYKYVWYPDFTHSGHFSHTLTVDSENFTHFGVYANNEVRITKVMVQLGNVEFPWSPAPEDLSSAVSANANSIQAVVNEVSEIEGNLQVLSQKTEKFSASIANAKLPTIVNEDRVNQWHLTVVSPHKTVVGAPTYEHLDGATFVDERYVYDDALTLSNVDNAALYFRAVVYCDTARTITVNLLGDDAHAVYVEGIKVFESGGYASNNISFYLPAGLSTIDMIASNGGGPGGFSLTPLLSSQVTWLKAVKSQGKDNADAISSIGASLTSLDGRVTANANQTTSLQAKLDQRKIYRLYSGGAGAATGSQGFIQGFNPDSIQHIGRSYGLVIFAGDGSIQSVNTYDVYGGYTQSFIDAVAAVPIGTWVAVITTDEPLGNSTLIIDALKSLGGTDAVKQTVYRSAYLLVGCKGLSEGSAIELVSSKPSMGCTYMLEMFNGVPTSLGGSSPQAGIVSQMRSEVTALNGNITSLSETVTSHTASLSVVARGTYSKAHVLDLRGLDENLYYPVVMELATSPSSKLRVLRTLGSFPERPSWSTHGAGFDCKLEWVATGDGWGTTSRDLTIIANDYRFAQAVPFLGLGQITESSLELIYLRGGAQYYLDTSSSASDPRIVTTAETHHGRTLAPMPYSDSYIVSAPDLKLKASAVALSQTQAQVVNIDGRVTSQASSITQLQTDVAGNSAKLIVQGEAVDGLKASYIIKTDVNGLVAGYGLYNTGNTSAFGVNADYFYVGKSDAGGKKPFMVLNTSQTIGGVTYPAGTWIDVALIANATIGSAHIANASITDAHIVSLNASKITAGIIDAERIGANSISVEKLMVGDATNLWGNQHFNPNGPLLSGNRTRIVTDMSELKGNGMQLWGRDHYASYSTKIPLKAGDTFVIEYIAGRNAGPDIPLNVGLWTYNINGNGGSAPWQFGPAEQIANLGNGWFRWRRIFVVTNHGHTLPVAYGVLYFMIEQAADEPNPAYWSVGDVTVRKGVGGELIVNGAITADKIQVGSLSAISANLGTIKVGSANIADLAVNAAHIADAAITTAKIGDLQVDSLKIKDDAVSIGIGAQGVATITTISNGGKLRLDIGVQAYYSSTYIATTMGVRVLRNGAIIRTFSFSATYLGSEGLTRFSYTCALPPIMETIAAGTPVTYRLQITDYNGNWREAGSNGLWVGTSGLSMAITELKK